MEIHRSTAQATSGGWGDLYAKHKRLLPSLQRLTSMLRRSPRVGTWCVLCAVLTSLAALILNGLLTSSARAADAPPAPRYTTKRDHDPNGIGKFYMGREIARVMTFHGAPWLERPEREEEERLSKLVELLDLNPGMSVADIGAGSGVITLLMSQKVGPEGKVYAVDIQKEMLDLLGTKLNQRNVLNVELVLGGEKSPQLKANTLDLAIMVDVYHEFEFPYEMMQAISDSLKPGGRVAFVEYRREDPDVPIKLIHKMSAIQVKKEMTAPELHLKFLDNKTELPRQHVLIFEKQAASSSE